MDTKDSLSINQDLKEAVSVIIVVFNLRDLHTCSISLPGYLSSAAQKILEPIEGIEPPHPIYKIGPLPLRVNGLSVLVSRGLIMKTCSECKKSLSLKSFYTNNSRKDKIGNYCRDCHNSYVKERWRQLKIKAIALYGNKCHDCKQSFHRAAYDFHHLDPKLKEFNWNILKRKSWDSITKELAKCVLLCSNCHRIRHALEH